MEGLFPKGVLCVHGRPWDLAQMTDAIVGTPTQSFPPRVWAPNVFAIAKRIASISILCPFENVETTKA
ncbi:hypothetical protein KIN20_020514 [Parelaphostrongylus tenuis]|uniref:Uncharacterized protein n=1 Tax=Parelaphostrongylus tenuis TaxID=148309 RepID=A0AAD5MRD2_PARTN|nr:hypothetical protein KIN20_020514 [Parelaphostrongylus tenuis]